MYKPLRGDFQKLIGLCEASLRPNVVHVHATAIPCLWRNNIHHSPASTTQAEGGDMICCLPLGKGFSQYVCSHVIHQTIHKVKCTAYHNLSNKVISQVNMFGVGMVIVICHKSKCGLIVAIKSCWHIEIREEFEYEFAKPNGFFCCVSGGDVFGFSRGQGHQFLLPRAPRDCTAVDEKDVASVTIRTRFTSFLPVTH